MTLFSWFLNTKNNNVIKKNNTHKEQELSTLNNNTMWPIAKVRNNTGTQRQKYISAKSQIKKDTETDILKERIS
ncbi:MAG: hypothetical protein WBC60_05685 [Cognaticolwellia sp.]|jgi:hypothetical protein